LTANTTRLTGEFIFGQADCVEEGEADTGMQKLEITANVARQPLLQVYGLGDPLKGYK
jgi:hypothetical protein